jgi:hypothetical protein
MSLAKEKVVKFVPSKKMFKFVHGGNLSLFSITIKYVYRHFSTIWCHSCSKPQTTQKHLRALVRENRADLTDRGRPIPSVFWLFNTLKSNILRFQELFVFEIRPPPSKPTIWKSEVTLDTASKRHNNFTRFTNWKLPPSRFYCLDLYRLKISHYWPFWNIY